jgi:CheY-like chemotaxis protein
MTCGESFMRNTPTIGQNMHSLKIELAESYTAAAAASTASEELLAKLLSKYKSAAITAKVESDSRISMERWDAENALKRVKETSNLELANQRLKFELAAVANFDASEMKINTLRDESHEATRRTIDVETRFETERRLSKENAEIATKSAATALADQQQKHERAISDALVLSTARQQDELREATIRAEEGVTALIAAERREWCRVAKTEQDSVMNNTIRKYEIASIAASDASELSLVKLRFQTQRETDGALEKFDCQINNERAESVIAAKAAQDENADVLAKQRCKFENEARIASKAYKCSISTLQEDSQTMIDAFNVEMVAKDLQIAVAKLAAERLESQILTERLEQASAEALRESELLMIMCGNLAHEMKSPLHALSQSMESLRTINPRTSAQFANELLDTLESACAFMRCAIGRTIDFTAASSTEGLTPCLTAFKLQESLDTPLMWMRSMLPSDGVVSLLLDPLPAGLDSIISDQRWMEDNLLCLLSNAVKVSKRGLVCVTVTLRDKMLRLSVADHGVGLDSSAKAKLFARTSQLVRATIGGNGLGLYSLSKRSEAIRGMCGVEDRMDGMPGSSVWFEVPFMAVTEQAPVPCSTRNSEHFESVIQSCARSGGDTMSQIPQKLRVLVVDDSTAVVKMLSFKLRSCGHVVEFAMDGEEGLQKMIACSSKLDVVIMDYQMPVMDGIESTRRFREWERVMLPERGGRRLPIICSSANCSGTALALASAAGVDSFLSKPFDLAALSAALRKAQTPSPAQRTD